MSPKAFQDWLTLPSTERRPLVMGILNVTPDSFSDGGQFIGTDRAIDHALQMVREGADLIDIGGESTRPGALPVQGDEQCRRVLPVIAGIIQKNPELSISIDTTDARVAADAMSSGAVLINDVSAGLDDPTMFPVAAEQNWPIVLMHRPGPSATMQADARYDDVVTEVVDFLTSRMRAAIQAGLPEDQIVLDPGIGFGKTTDHDLALLREIPLLRSLGRPLLIGVSRKKFIGAFTGVSTPAHRVFGTAAAVAWSIACGADIVRVHDVAAMVQAVAVARNFRSAITN